MTEDTARFFVCKHCGNVVGLIHNSGVPLVCCGEEMTELHPNTSGASQEKHAPVIEVSGNRVTVRTGEVEHTMSEEHSIQWIYLQTRRGGQRKAFYPGQKPEAVFLLEDDDPVAAYAYCNLDGLWRTEV